MDKAAKHTSAWADAATGQMHPARSHEVHARVRSFREPVGACVPVSMLLWSVTGTATWSRCRAATLFER